MRKLIKEAVENFVLAWAKKIVEERYQKVGVVILAPNVLTIKPLN